METPHPIDPVLALLDYLERYRDTRRCCFYGGPAALDDVRIAWAGRTAGVRATVEWHPLWDVSERKFYPENPPGGWTTHAGELLAEGPQVSLPEGAGAASLCEYLRAAGVTDAGQLAEIRDWGEGVEAEETEENRRRLRYRVRIAQAGTVGVLLGNEIWQFACAGTEADEKATFKYVRAGTTFFAGVLRSLRQPHGWLQVINLANLANMVRQGVTGHTQGIMAMAIASVMLSLLPWTGLRYAWGHFVGRRRARPVPLAVVAGPDPAAAARFLSLFAHLAAFAQCADPAEGGVVHDDAWPALVPYLQEDAPPPEFSSTCRVDLAPGIAEDARLRLVHMLCPGDGRPDDLRARLLRRAGRIWIVLPAGMPAAAADGYLDRLLAGALARDTPVTLVWDGAAAPPAPAEMPLTQRALAGRNVRTLVIPLADTCRRYLRGGVSPDEAASLVRALVSTEGVPAALAGTSQRDGESLPHVTPEVPPQRA